MKKSMLEKLKAEKQKLEEKKSEYTPGEKIEWFKPVDGDNLIRILPKGDDVPYVEVRLHYISVKKKDGTVVHGFPVRCWNDLDSEEKCPICEYASNLMKSKSEKDQENGKRFRASTRYLYNVIDYQNKAVKPASFTTTIHEQIVGNLFDMADEDILDVETGNNWKLIRKKKGKEAFQVDYQLRLDVRKSAVPAKLMPLVEEAIDLETLYTNKEEKMVKAFVGYRTEESEDEDDYTPPKKKAKPSIDEDEDYTPKKKKVVEEDEDDDMAAKLKAKSKAKKVVEDDEEDEPTPPKKKAFKKDEDLDLDDVEDFDVDDMLDSI